MKKLVISTIAVAMVAGLTSNALAVTKTKEVTKTVATGASFKVNNKTGKVITSLKLKHGAAWGNDALSTGVLMDGASTTITTKDTACKMSVRVTYKGEKKAWIVPDADLCSITAVTLWSKGGKLTYKTEK